MIIFALNQFQTSKVYINGKKFEKKKCFYKKMFILFIELVTYIYIYMYMILIIY